MEEKFSSGTEFGQKKRNNVFVKMENFRLNSVNPTPLPSMISLPRGSNKAILLRKESLEYLQLPFTKNIEFMATERPKKKRKRARPVQRVLKPESKLAIKLKEKAT